MSNYNRLAQMLAYAKEMGEDFVFLPVDRVPDLMAELAISAPRISVLEEELDKYRNGYKGGCWTCETVAELNVKQGARIATAGGSGRVGNKLRAFKWWWRLSG